MYFPVGWPRLVDLEIIKGTKVCQISCDRVKILIGIVAEDFLGIWYAKPLIPVVYYKRTEKSIRNYGGNLLLTWKPDSSMIAVATELGNVILYSLHVEEATKSAFNQIDSPFFSLRRDSSELYIKEAIPRFSLKQVCNISLRMSIASLACVSLSQVMAATSTGKIFRLRWDGSEDTDLMIDLRHEKFGVGKFSNLETSCYVNSMDYSPLLGGLVITFSNGKAAFLTTTDLKFEPQREEEKEVAHQCPEHFYICLKSVSKALIIIENSNRS